MAKLKLTGLEYAYIVQRKNVIDHHIPQNLNVYILYYRLTPFFATLETNLFLRSRK